MTVRVGNSSIPFGAEEVRDRSSEFELNAVDGSVGPGCRKHEVQLAFDFWTRIDTIPLLVLRGADWRFLAWLR